MAELTQKKSSAKNTANKPTAKAHRKEEEAQTKKKAGKPAYLQKKMSVSTPGDTQEQEADRVAEEVSRQPRTISRQTHNTLQRASATSENIENEEQSLQAARQVSSHKTPQISRVTEPEEASAKLMRKDDELNTKLHRMETEEETAQPKLHRMEEEVQAKLFRQETEEESLQAMGTPVLSDESEQKIEALRGMGVAMQEDVQRDMEEKIGANFSNVRIHTNNEANQLAQEINARAFTVGNDVFFAAGEYAPETEQGRKLLAHELTHVVQQSGGVSTKLFRSPTMVQRNGPTSPPAAPPPATIGSLSTGLIDTSAKTITYDSIDIPAFKARDHRGVTYNSWKSGHGLKRDKNYSATSRPNDQIDVWERDLNKGDIVEKLREKTTPAGPSVNGQYAFQAARRREYYVGSLEEIALATSRPQWGKSGSRRSMQVDHIVEMQISGHPSNSSAHDISNMEMLESGGNRGSGNFLKNKIAAKARLTYRDTASQNYLNAEISSLSQESALQRPYAILRNFTVIFNDFNGSGGPSVSDNNFWKKSEIEDGDHVEHLRESGLSDIAGEEQVLVFNGPYGGQSSFYQWDGSNRTPTNSEKNRLWPWRLTEKEFYTSPDQTGDEDVGNFYLELPDSDTHEAIDQEIITVKRFQNQRNVGGLELEQSFMRMAGIRLKKLSPVQIESAELRDNGLFALGKVTPTIPLFQAVQLDYRIENREIKVSKTFSSGEINVPSPFTLDDCSLSLFLSSNDGLGVEGRMDFGIDNVGTGFLGAAASTENGFALNGEFNFDERIFGEGTTAQVRMGYADEQWSMGGTVTIPEGKVPGVTSATINVDYSEAEGFSAQGDATLNVPGVESGSLSISHTEEAGFSIGGTFNLSADTPGIRGGTISATLREKEDGSGFAVSARGEAQPDIPGINSNLTVAYDDGAFTAEVEAQYARGMLSGRLNAGVTNRSVGENGELSDTAEPDNPLIVYGGGSLTLQLAPWLQGTAGVQFAPDGEITVTGEIGLPSELEIFARREINKSIFSIAVQAPVFPGIVAEIGGGLSATAGIGPGVIDQLRLGITYNPAHEEDTTITGDAHLNIPANAGLRLAVRAGIGLGITGASATGGLEIGGTLGIEGAAEAGVHVEWSPSNGLDLSANVGVHAQPSFTFDIGGYISVRALGFEVYDETFQFASYTFGSDYRFGISLPIHYQEGEPFDISLDDVEFEVPDINTNQLLRSLIARIS